MTGEMTGLLFPCLRLGETTGPDCISAADDSLTGLLHSRGNELCGKGRGALKLESTWHPSALIIGCKAVIPASQVACSYRPTCLTHLLGLLNTFSSESKSCYILRLNYEEQFLKKLFSA